MWFTSVLTSTHIQICADSLEGAAQATKEGKQISCHHGWYWFFTLHTQILRKWAVLVVPRLVIRTHPFFYVEAETEAATAAFPESPRGARRFASARRNRRGWPHFAEADAALPDLAQLAMAVSRRDAHQDRGPP
jgi:hypothetical protein